jgi:hypothetical protein
VRCVQIRVYSPLFHVLDNAMALIKLDRLPRTVGELETRYSHLVDYLRDAEGPQARRCQSIRVEIRFGAEMAAAENFPDTVEIRELFSFSGRTSGAFASLLIHNDSTVNFIGTLRTACHRADCW